MRWRVCAVTGLLWLASALASPADAEAADPWSRWATVLFQRVTTADPQADAMGATAFAQDRDGFLWVGTQNGLMRWDGYRFRVYNSDPERPGGLPDGFVQALHVDARGQLWIGTGSQGLVRYRAQSDDFESIGAGANGLSHVSVNSLADAADGGLWIGTAGGLDHVDPSGRNPRHVPLPGPAGAQVATQPSVRAIVASRDGDLWVGTSQGLFRGDAQGRHIAPVVLGGVMPETRHVRSLMQDSLGRIWVALDAGLRLLDPKAGTVSVLGASGGTPPVQRERVVCMLETAAGEVWLGTRGAGIITVDLHTLRTRSYVRKSATPYGLASNDIWALYRDRSGLTWVGTIDSVMRAQGEPTVARTLTGGNERTALLSSDEVSMIAPMPDGRLLLGAGFNGVDLVDPLAGRVGSWRPDAARPDDALPVARVAAGVFAPGRGAFVAMWGVYLVDPVAGRVRRAHVPGRPPTQGVDALHYDEQGLWIGGQDGLWQLRWTQDGTPIATHHDPHAQELSDQRVIAIAPAGQGRLWLGTRNGLNLFDTRAGHTLAVLLRGTFVTTVFADARGRLWVGTGGNGLYVIDAPLSDAPSIRHLGVRDGLPNNLVNAILSDDDGRLWLSTDQGLAVVDPQSLRVRALGPSNGVGIAQFWSTAGARTAQGDLLFGGLGGAVVVRPRELPAPKLPRPVLTELRLGDSALPVGGFNGQAARGSLTLPPQTRGFSAEFSALDFNDPQTNRYSYRLVGFDKEWVEADATRRIATYTNIAPGDYVLEIRAASAGGAWSDPPLRIDVVAQPAWYQTVWFRLTMLAFVLLAVVGLDRARHLLLVRRQRELHQLVDERTAALQASEARLAQMAYFDALTGLPNRRRLVENYEQAAARARRADAGFALLLIDLDRFKQINDSLGHAAGDALLVAAAERLRSCVREVDTVARLGGDEFAILLDEAVSVQGVDAVCQRIVEAFEAPAMYGATAMAVSPSIGAAFYPRHGNTLDELSKAADKALYDAKAAGRNTWRMAAAADESDA